MFGKNVILNKLILVVAFSTCAMSDNAFVEITNNVFQRKAIKYHNYYRALHGSPPLRHSKELENFARKRAIEIARKDGTNFHHPDDLEWGENLAWNSIVNVDCQIPLKLWYEEWLNPGYNYKRPNITPKNGHFTQMVWKETAKVGCGQAVSKGRKGGTYTVCNYDPPGNYISEEKANVVPATKQDYTPPPMMRSRRTKVIASAFKSRYKATTFLPKPRYKATTLLPKPRYKATTLLPKPRYKATTFSPKPRYKATTFSPKPRYKATTFSPKPHYKAITKASKSKKENTKAPQKTSQKKLKNFNSAADNDDQDNEQDNNQNNDQNNDQDTDQNNDQDKNLRNQAQPTPKYSIRNPLKYLKDRWRQRRGHASAND